MDFVSDCPKMEVDFFICVRYNSVKTLQHLSKDH